MPTDLFLDDWRVQPSLNRLTRGATTVRLEPKLMDVLLFLIRNAGSVVSKDEIAGAVWPETFLSESVITRAIAGAVKSISSQSSEKRIVVLVSDGTESCKGDPCETARSLANDDPRLIVHTIGIGVNLVAEKQLLCIARAAGGQYFEARDADSLERALRKVAALRQTISLPADTGQIILRNADLVDQAFAPINLESGEAVDGAALAGSEASIAVAAGTYRIDFGKGVAIDGIVVRKGGKTIVDPAVLEVHNAGGAALVFKAGEATPVGGTSEPGVDGAAFMLLAPGTYDIKTDNFVWKGFQLSAGRRTVVDGARVTIKASAGKVYQVKTAGGEAIGEIADGGGLTLPGGSYLISNGGAETAFDIKPGEKLDLEIP